MSNPLDCITEFVFIEHQPSKADFILIPGGSHDQLMVRAIELYKQGICSINSSIRRRECKGPGMGKRVEAFSRYCGRKWCAVRGDPQRGSGSAYFR